MELLRRHVEKPASIYMKAQTNSKSGHHTADPTGVRAGGMRASAAKTFEHRYERRKIRAQLRRLDWTLHEADGIFA